MRILRTVVKQFALAAVLVVGKRIATKVAGKVAAKIRRSASAAK